MVNNYWSYVEQDPNLFVEAVLREAFKKAQGRKEEPKSYRGPVTGEVVSQSAIKARAISSAGGILAVTDVEYEEIE